MIDNIVGLYVGSAAAAAGGGNAYRGITCSRNLLWF